MAKTLDEHISQYCQVVLETCAYAGTGDVLKVQQMLATASEHLTTEDDTAWKVRGSLSPTQSLLTCREACTWGRRPCMATLCRA